MKPFLIAALVIMASAGGCVAPRAAAAPPSDSVTNALEWALGSSSRVPNPSSMDAYLLIQPSDKPLEQATRGTSECFEATSFLPGPSGDPRIFFSAKGRLSVRRAPGEKPALLEHADPTLKVRRLLAFVAAASPLEILVEAQPDGASSPQVWLLTVGEREVLSLRHFEKDPALKNKTAFFQKFRVPRCLEGSHECLVLSTDDHKFYLDIEPERGKRPTLLKELGSAAVRDAAWASADGGSVYLLMACGSSRP